MSYINIIKRFYPLVKPHYQTWLLSHPRTIANTPGAALGDGKKLVNKFMAANPKLCPGADPQEFPRCRLCPRDGDRPSNIDPIALIVCPA